MEASCREEELWLSRVWIWRFRMSWVELGGLRSIRGNDLERRESIWRARASFGREIGAREAGGAGD
jgi:hypothetical protein